VRDQQKDVIGFIESVFRFCLKRVSNRMDAEDLASEIILHVLEGIRKYEINLC
jgi:DNA-directed RNA polymerase specialized sigma24 family protein